MKSTTDSANSGDTLGFRCCFQPHLRDWRFGSVDGLLATQRQTGIHRLGRVIVLEVIVEFVVGRLFEIRIVRGRHWESGHRYLCVKLARVDQRGGPPSAQLSGGWQESDRAELNVARLVLVLMRIVVLN